MWEVDLRQNVHRVHNTMREFLQMAHQLWERQSFNHSSSCPTAVNCCKFHTLSKAPKTAPNPILWLCGLGGMRFDDSTQTISGTHLTMQKISKHNQVWQHKREARNKSTVSMWTTLCFSIQTFQGFFSTELMIISLRLS